MVNTHYSNLHKVDYYINPHKILYPPGILQKRFISPQNFKEKAFLLSYVQTRNQNYPAFFWKPDLDEHIAGIARMPM